MRRARQLAISALAALLAAGAAVRAASAEKLSVTPVIGELQPILDAGSRRKAR